RHNHQMVSGAPGNSLSTLTAGPCWRRWMWPPITIHQVNLPTLYIIRWSPRYGYWPIAPNTSGPGRIGFRPGGDDAALMRSSRRALPIAPVLGRPTHADCLPVTL